MLDNQHLSTLHAPTIVVVMGRPGAGKSTITARAVELANDRGSLLSTPTTTATARIAHTKIVPLDLDVCVPDWMRANFAVGLYPTLPQRQDFATVCCDYVENQRQREATNEASAGDVGRNNINGAGAATTVVLLVSFSFVNVDLRESFRDRFPNAHWILIDTSESEAQRRIEHRQGHFYKGSKQTDKHMSDRDNIDWKFAPVTFPHIILDGLVSVDENVARVL